MSKLRRKKPKVKMRSYGSGEKLPVVKSGGDFFLADQKYDNLGHGKFEGQTTGKLEGPSKRAIKGKGKKSGNVRVSSKLEGGDPIFLEDTSPMKMKNDYSSMKSMGQAVAKWTSPLAQKGDAGKTPYVKPKSITEFSKDHGSGKKDAQGNFEYVTTYDRYNFPTKKKNPNYLSKPQPGSNPQAAANTDLFKVKNYKKELPIGIRKPEDVPESSKKPTPTSTVKPKPKVKPKAELLEKVEKRPSTIGQDRERIDNERMRQTIASANDSEKLMAGLSRKEKRKMARYDRKKERGLTPEKAVKATEITQTLGSFLKDIGKPDSKVQKAGVTNPVDTEDTTTDTDTDIDDTNEEKPKSWIEGGEDVSGIKTS